MLIDQANRHKADVYWKYSLVPWMALNVVNNLRLNNPNDGPTGTLRTACNMPYRFRVPQDRSPHRGQTSHTVSLSSLTDMVTTFRTWGPTFNAHFNVVRLSSLACVFS
jgi:hypothetical protein